MLKSQIPAAAPEVVALGSAIADVLGALHEGKGSLDAAKSALPDLLAASETAKNIGADIKLAHNQVYLGWAILQVYEAEGENAA